MSLAVLACTSCSSPVAEGSRFCAACGAELQSEETPTGTAPRGAARTPASRRSPSSSRAGDVPRVAGEGFEPGLVLLERYRVLGLIGRGGMGEVYQADDLTLGQRVALKFLPGGLGDQPSRLERFFNEVRLARQISHPAVCRVHDVGEVGGRHFLSMEYVDGENLASLLRRIGRLAPHKAIDVARQLCAGLAAAHERGVLHRDLKPENVMLDGRGKVRITDFGLAGLMGAIEGDDVRSGTPAYMAPEQLSGREVSERSDVYALGLVLFELFTGQRAFAGRTLSELKRQHEQDPPPDPATLAPDLDPATEAAILRCLAKEPRQRPASALAVAALLPGGDPLAAAIAAGITPSPEMVAAAGEAEALRPGFAWANVALALVAVGVLLFVLTPRLGLIARVPLPKPPAVLEDKARALLEQLAPGLESADAADGLQLDWDYFRQRMERDRSRTRFVGLATDQPPVLHFWHRSSPRPLVSEATRGRIKPQDPPATLPGMAGVRMDASGRLLEFYRVPQRTDLALPARAEPDWAPFFAQAGLEPAAWRSATPRWTPAFYADARRAWEGQGPAGPMRVEAAALNGQAVWFALVPAWRQPESSVPAKLFAGQEWAELLGSLLVLGTLMAGLVLARRQLQLGRGDRRGATRLAGALLLMECGAFLLDSHHAADLGQELDLLSRGLAFTLLGAAILWTLYIGLEPYVRRRWPQALISWARLLDGRWRDGRVGRDVLVGVCAGSWVIVLLELVDLLTAATGRPEALPHVGTLEALMGFRALLARLADRLFGATLTAIVLLLMLLLARMLLRRDWLALLCLALLVGSTDALWRSDPWLQAPAHVLVILLLTGVLLRYGLLACVVALYATHMLGSLPLTSNFTSWAAAPTLGVLLVLAGLCLHALRCVRAGHGLEPGALPFEPGA